MSKAEMFCSISRDRLASLVALLDQRQELLVRGHRILHPVQDLLLLGLVVLELALELVQDHLPSGLSAISVLIERSSSSSSMTWSRIRAYSMAAGSLVEVSSGAP